MCTKFGKLFVVLVFILYGVAPAVTHAVPCHHRFIGGSSARNDNASYIVAVRILGRHVCGGAIINERTVITAASCIYKAEKHGLQVVAGSQTLSQKDGQFRRIETIFTHHLYNNVTNDNDVGLLRLPVELKYSNTIQPIRLAGPAERVPDHSWAMAFGWDKGDGVLHNQEVVIVNQQTCLDVMHYVTDRMICAIHPGGGPDAGEHVAGSPLVQNNTLIGMVSWGPRPDESGNKPSVYARVAALQSWVNHILYKAYHE